MTLPDNVWLYVVLALAVLAAVLYAIRRRANLEVTKTGVKVSHADAPNRVVIGPSSIKDAEVGNVTGVRGGPPPAGSSVSVLEGTSVTKSKIGDITGVDQSPPQKS
jgi:hypothetical protein